MKAMNEANIVSDTATGVESDNGKKSDTDTVTEKQKVSTVQRKANIYECLIRIPIKINMMQNYFCLQMLRNIGIFLFCFYL